MRRLSSFLRAFALLCIAVHAHGQITSSGSAAPLHVALIRFADLPHQPAKSSHATAAATLRAAGYPVSPHLSQPVFARAADVLPPPQGQVSSKALDWATPVPLGTRGPTLVGSAASSSSSSTRRRRRRLQQQQQHGFQLASSGFASAAGAVPAGTVAMAVGPHHLLAATGGMVTLHNLSQNGSIVRNSSRSVALAALLQPGAPAGDCQGVFDPSAAYDATAGRFLLTATCGGQGLVLLAASTSSDAAGTWFVYSLVADGAGTPLACNSSGVLESALVDYTQVSYNADGVYVTYKSFCPSSSSSSNSSSTGGAGLLALPKWALYRGMSTFQYPMYASHGVMAAAAAAAAAGAGADAAAAGAATAAGVGAKVSPAAGCAQLVPVVPQKAADVGLGEAYFVCEVVDADAPSHSTGRSIVVAALLDTATLWQYGGPVSNASTPLLVAQVVGLQAPAPPVSGLPLRQPNGAPPLQHGTRPRGFWNGAAVKSGGKLYLATSTLVTSDKASPTYSRRPAIAWAELGLSAATSGTDTCVQSRAGVASRQAWDPTKDYSIEWSQQHAAAAQAMSAPLMQPATAAASSSSSSDRVVHAAAFVPGLGMAAAYKGMGLLTSATVGLYQLGAQPCTCYACYWGGSYNRYQGYNGGALAGTGFSSGANYFVNGQMTRCQNFCTKCWYYGYPGHGFGNVGQDKQFLDAWAAAPFAANISGPSRSDVPSISNAYEAVLSSLFAPCTRSGSLQVQVQRQGVVSQGGQHPLGLVFPALAVSPGGALLLAFSYSGPGEASIGTPAFPGVGATVVQPGDAGSSNTVGVVKAGRGTIQPATLSSPGSSAAALSGGWAELSAAGVHGPSGTVFTTTPYAAAAAAGSGRVGMWIAAWHAV